MPQYYWRMHKGGELIGPTFSCFADKEEAKAIAIKEIKEIMGVKELPDDFELVAPIYKHYRSDAKQNKAAEKQEKERNKAREKSVAVIKEALKGLPYEHIGYRGIDPKTGNSIYIHCAYHSVELPSNSGHGRRYNLDNPKQKEKFRKEIIKRFEERVKRQKRSKKIKGRTTNIGSFKHITTQTIQNAEFAIYLDPDQDITEADVHVIGSVKFYKKSPRQCMFDIDERKILTRDGEQEIEADNTNQVIDALIECLAGQRKKDA